MSYNEVDIVWILGTGIQLCNLIYYLYCGENSCDDFVKCLYLVS